MGSIQEFILKRKQLGHITTARFDVEMTFQGWGEKDLLEEDAIEFSLASIDLPTVRANYEQVYFDTMPVEAFKNFTYDPDFSMTVICDNEGRIYKQFLDLILRKENVVGQSGQFNDNYEGNFDFKQKIEPDISLTVKTLVDTGTSKHKFNNSTHNPNKYGLIYKLYGVYIKNIGNLSFSNNSPEIMTFSVNAAATSFEVNPEKDSPYADDVQVEYVEPTPEEQEKKKELRRAYQGVVDAYRESMTPEAQAKALAEEEAKRQRQETEENKAANAEIDKMLVEYEKTSNIPEDTTETKTPTGEGKEGGKGGEGKGKEEVDKEIQNGQALAASQAGAFGPNIENAGGVAVKNGPLTSVGGTIGGSKVDLRKLTPTIVDNMLNNDYKLGGWGWIPEIPNWQPPSQSSTPNTNSDDAVINLPPRPRTNSKASAAENYYSDTSTINVEQNPTFGGVLTRTNNNTHIYTTTIDGMDYKTTITRNIKGDVVNNTYTVRDGTGKQIYPATKETTYSEHKRSKSSIALTNMALEQAMNYILPQKGENTK